MKSNKNMKKLFSALFLASFLVVSVIPLIAEAQVDAPTTCTMKRDINLTNPTITCVAGDEIEIDGTQSICCVLNTIYSAVDWIFVILVAVASIFIILGAMNIITAGGDSAKVGTGRNYIMYAALGLFVAFIARAIPGLVVQIVSG
jgi:hypothetical protein